MEARWRLDSKGFCYKLDLIEDLVAPACKDFLKNTGDRTQVLFDVINPSFDFEVIVSRFSICFKGIILFFCIINPYTWSTDHGNIVIILLLSDLLATQEHPLVGSGQFDQGFLTLVENLESLLVELTAMPISSIADLYHQVYKVLDAEYSVKVNRVLLVYVLDEIPELIDHLNVVCIDPIVAAHH